MCPREAWARKILDFLRKKEPEFLDTDLPVAGRDSTEHEGTILSSTKQNSEKKHLSHEIITKFYKIHVLETEIEV